MINIMLVLNSFGVQLHVAAVRWILRCFISLWFTPPVNVTPERQWISISCSRWQSDFVLKELGSINGRDQLGYVYRSPVTCINTVECKNLWYMWDENQKQVRLQPMPRSSSQSRPVSVTYLKLHWITKPTSQPFEYHRSQLNFSVLWNYSGLYVNVPDFFPD